MDFFTFSYTAADIHECEKDFALPRTNSKHRHALYKTRLLLAYPLRVRIQSPSNRTTISFRPMNAWAIVRFFWLIARFVPMKSWSRRNRLTVMKSVYCWKTFSHDCDMLCIRVKSSLERESFRIRIRPSGCRTTNGTHQSIPQTSVRFLSIARKDAFTRCTF